MKLLTRTAAVLAALMLFTPAAALADHAPRSEPNVGLKIADLAVARPLSLIVSLASTGVFTALLPLTTLTGVGDESAYVLLAAPWRYTAGRHLGDFDGYRDGLTIYGTLRRLPAHSH